MKGIYPHSSVERLLFPTVLSLLITCSTVLRDTERPADHPQKIDEYGQELMGFTIPSASCSPSVDKEFRAKTLIVMSKGMRWRAGVRG